MFRAIVVFVWELRRTIVAIGLIAFGSYESDLSIAYHAQRTLTFAAFAAAPPAMGWYHITGVPLDYGRAKPFVTRDHPVTGLYIPAADASGKIPLFVADEIATPEPSARRRTQDVDGTLETFFESDSKRDAALAPLEADLAPHYQVIDKGYKPSLAFGLIAGVLGLVLGALLLLGAIGLAVEDTTRRSRSRES